MIEKRTLENLAVGHRVYSQKAQLYIPPLNFQISFCSTCMATKRF